MTKVTMLPPLPEEKSFQMPLEGDTTNEGVFSSLNGEKAFVVGSGPFEYDEIAHHFLDARFGKHPVYRLAGDHRAKEICGRIFPSIFSVTRYVGRTPASPKGPEARVREVSRGLSEA